MFGRRTFWLGKEKLAGTVIRIVLLPLIVTGDIAGNRIGVPCPDNKMAACCDVTAPARLIDCNDDDRPEVVVLEDDAEEEELDFVDLHGLSRATEVPVLGPPLPHK